MILPFSLKELVSKNWLLPALIILALFHSSYSAKAQQRDSTAVFQVETRDGNEYIGNIVYEDKEKLRLKTAKLGKLTFRKIDVIKIRSFAKNKT